MLALASLDLACRDRRPVSATFTTIAFDDSNLQWLEVSDLIAEPEDLPHLPYRYATAVWTGVTRDTRPVADMGSGDRTLGLLHNRILFEALAQKIIDLFVGTPERKTSRPGWCLSPSVAKLRELVRLHHAVSPPVACNEPRAVCVPSDEARRPTSR
jgi:hypothetical protein